MINPYGMPLYKFFDEKARLRSGGPLQKRINERLLDERQRQAKIESDIFGTKKYVLKHLELEEDPKCEMIPTAGISSPTKPSPGDEVDPELAELRRKRFVEEKRRQQFRENNEELRELEVKLRAAYAFKSLSEQIAERKALQAQEREKEIKESKLVEMARLKHLEQEKLREETEVQKKAQYRQELCDQMKFAEQEKTKHYKDFLTEKQIVDEIARNLYEEQLEDLKLKREKQKEFHEGLDEFIQMQKEYKASLKKKMDEENKRIEALTEVKEKRMGEQKAKKLEEIETRGKISREIGERVLAMTEEKRKKEEILQNLYAEQQRLKEAEKFREEVENELRQRVKMRLELDEILKDKERRKRMEEEEDRKYLQEQLSFLAERDKIDQYTSEVRRGKILEHTRTIKACLEEKRIRRAQEFAALIKERDENMKEEERRQKLIEEERIRILKEHADNLMGYFPPGLLTESDREHIPLPKNGNE